MEFLVSYEEKNAVEIVFSTCKVYLPTGDMIDYEKEKARLNKELEKTRQQIIVAEQMLSNERFRQNAPEKAKQLEQTHTRNKELEQNLLNSLKNLNE